VLTTPLASAAVGCSHPDHLTPAQGCCVHAVGQARSGESVGMATLRCQQPVQLGTAQLKVDLKMIQNDPHQLAMQTNVYQSNEGIVSTMDGMALHWHYQVLCLVPLHSTYQRMLPCPALVACSCRPRRSSSLGHATTCSRPPTPHPWQVPAATCLWGAGTSHRPTSCWQHSQGAHPLTGLCLSSSAVAVISERRLAALRLRDKKQRSPCGVPGFVWLPQKRSSGGNLAPLLALPSNGQQLHDCLQL
jgi:hypothetical protein